MVDPSAPQPTPLLVRIARGEEDAVRACLDAYGGLVWSIARRFLRDNEDAADAVQDAFIDIWSHANRFDPARGSEPTFVAMIARRRVIDRVRRNRRRPAAAPLDDPGAIPAGDDTERIEIADEAARVRELVDTLRPEQRQVLELSIHRGLSHQGIADELAMPLGTVKTHVRRGLQRVRDLLARDREGRP